MTTNLMNKNIPAPEAAAEGSAMSGKSTKDNNEALVFDASVLQNETNIPKEFIWPDHEKPGANPPQLQVPLIDLQDFFSEDPTAIKKVSELVGQACREHGFFLVTNHGVDDNLISEAHRYMDLFFDLPLSEKHKAQRKLGEHCGYASSFTGRFSSKLPWKETLTFQYSAKENSSTIVQDYITKTMGENFAQLG